jgi:hypothetical protein
MVTSAAARAKPAAYKNLPQTIPDVAVRVERAQLVGRGALGGETNGKAPFDQTGYPDCALHNVLKLPCRRQDDTMDDTNLMAEMDQRSSPVIIEIQWYAGGSHVILLRGYTPYRDGSIFYDVCDPEKEKCFPMNLKGLLNYDNKGCWQGTYLDVGISL